MFVDNFQFFKDRQCVYEYSRVLNKRPGTLINFGEKFHPRHAYSNHPVYLNLKHIPPTFTTDAFLRKMIN